MAITIILLLALQGIVSMVEAPSLQDEDSVWFRWSSMTFLETPIIDPGAPTAMDRLPLSQALSVLNKKCKAAHTCPPRHL